MTAMLGVTDLASFLIASTLTIIVPGPATVYVAGKARASTRAAGLASAGIIVGDLLLIALSGLGFAALVARWPALLAAIRVVGALYIAYLGVGLLRTRPAAVAAPAPDRATRGHFARGCLITLTNPKPILFFSVFFPSFIDPAAPSRVQAFAVLATIFEALNLVWFAAWILAVRGLRRMPALDRLDAVCGAGLVLCGAFLLGTMFV